MAYCFNICACWEYNFEICNKKACEGEEMIKNILNLLSLIPEIIKKGFFIKASNKREKEYEELNKECKDKDDNHTVNNLRDIL